MLVSRLWRISIAALLLAGSGTELSGQEPEVGPPDYPISVECRADACEEAAMMLAGILGMLESDTELARFHGSPIVARVLQTLHLNPENPACAALSREGSPALAAVDRSLQTFAERRAQPLALVTCAEVFTAPGSRESLTPGPPVLVLSPVDWMGVNDARFLVSLFLAPGWHGKQYVVYLHRGPTGWDASRIGVGMGR